MGRGLFLGGQSNCHPKRPNSIKFLDICSMVAVDPPPLLLSPVCCCIADASLLPAHVNLLAYVSLPAPRRPMRAGKNGMLSSTKGVVVCKRTGLNLYFI